MGTFLTVLAVGFFIWIIVKGANSNTSNSSRTRPSSNGSSARRPAPSSTPPRPSSPPSRPSSPPSPQKKDNIYRPTPRAGHTSSVIFRNTDQSTSSSPGNVAGTVSSYADLSGLHDAFTGAPLNPQLGLYQCGKCKVYYHTESFEILRQENSSRCVACSSQSIQSVTEKTARSEPGRDHRPDVVTLSNYKNFVGRVVTFEGTVRDVKVSKNGTDYAVMFEYASWTKGFKLIFFRKSISRVGGVSFINSLKGKTVCVRGLVVNHPVFGYEIIVSERSMILSII
jgi:hypothetical protein